jgi:hypothetical protein
MVAHIAEDVVSYEHQIPLAAIARRHRTSTASQEADGNVAGSWTRGARVFQRQDSAMFACLRLCAN